MTEPSAPAGKHESPIRRILVESALIVFSILLAFAANQWNDARKQQALVERSLRSVRDEIAGNAKRVQERLPYHRSLERETFLADSSKRVRSFADLKLAAPDWSGFNNPELDGTAWQTAITLGAVTGMGFDTVRTLSRLYAMQGKVDQFASGSISSFDFADQAMPATVRRMWVYFFTSRVLEDTLLNRYAGALKLIGAPDTK
jgi:hypothetical protein